MSSVLNGCSAPQCIKHGNTSNMVMHLKIHNRIAFNFYPELPHMPMSENTSVWVKTQVHEYTSNMWWCSDKSTWKGRNTNECCLLWVHIYDCHLPTGPSPPSSTIFNQPSPPRPSLEPAAVTYSPPHLLPKAHSGNMVDICLGWVSPSSPSLGGLPYYWLTEMPPEVNIHAMYNRKLTEVYLLLILYTSVQRYISCNLQSRCLESN